MTPNEASRLAAAINSHRPDWKQSSLLSFITKNLLRRAYRDASVALTWVATDPASQTPARVLENGPWWTATGHGDQAATPTPPKLADMRCKCGVWVVRGETHTCARPSVPTAEFLEAKQQAATAAARAAHKAATKGDGE